MRDSGIGCYRPPSSRALVMTTAAKRIPNLQKQPARLICWPYGRHGCLALWAGHESPYGDFGLWWSWGSRAHDNHKLSGKMWSKLLCEACAGSRFCGRELRGGMGIERVNAASLALMLRFEGATTWSPTACKIMAFWLSLEVLGHWFPCCWGPSKPHTFSVHRGSPGA